MSQVSEVCQRLLDYGVCFVEYEDHTETVHALFNEVHQTLSKRLDIYDYVSVHHSVLGMFLSRIELEHGVAISNTRPLGRRLLSLQGKLRREVLLSLERGKGQEEDLATILSDCVDAQRYRPGWLYLLIGITPTSKAELLTLHPRLYRRFFMGDERIVRMVD